MTEMSSRKVNAYSHSSVVWGPFEPIFTGVLWSQNVTVNNEIKSGLRNLNTFSQNKFSKLIPCFSKCTS